jgi:sodium transport system ATP-binding protein
MIFTHNISKTFYDHNKEITAVKSTNLKIEKGEVYGLIGPNGAGKTTLLRMLATILTPSSGGGTINGLDLIKDKEEIKKKLGFLSGNTKLYGRLNPKELLQYFGELNDMSKIQIKQRYEEVVEILGLQNIVSQQIEKLSTGQTQRVSLARCIFHDPDVYLLDEPTLGLDILSSKSILDFIKREKEKGKTIIYSSHIMQELETIVDRIGLIYNGKVLIEDTLENLKIKSKKDTIVEFFIDIIERGEEQLIDEHKEINYSL